MIQRYLVSNKPAFNKEFMNYVDTAQGLPKGVEDLTFSLDEPNPEYYILHMFNTTVIVPKDPIVISIDMAGRPEDMEKARTRLEDMIRVKIKKDGGFIK